MAALPTLFKGVNIASRQQNSKSREELAIQQGFRRLKSRRTLKAPI
jgi:hypothetical protein